MPARGASGGRNRAQPAPRPRCDLPLLALAQRAQQLDAALANNEEIKGFLAALDGKHLAASYGGDPVRNPISPTGRNL